MPYSESKRQYNARYSADKRCKLTIDMSPAQRAQINDFCKDKGGTATFMKKLIRDEMLKAGIRPLKADEPYHPE